MSHFSVLITGPDHEAQLKPHHEFESDGIDDQYVVDVDETEKARAEFEKATEVRMREIATGALFERFDEEGNWVERFSQPDSDLVFGTNSRRKEFIPEGFERVELPAKELISFADWASGYYGREIVRLPARRTAGAHKYGHILVDEKGEVLKVIDRTNPQAKWDWYEIGGRWSNRLLFKDGTRGNQGRVGELDLDGMIMEKASSAAILYDRVMSEIGGREVQTWEQVLKRHEAGEFDIDTARKFYHNQPVIKDLTKKKTLDSWDSATDLSRILAAKDRESYIDHEAKTNSTTWAMLHNGHWNERGSMGWFGMSDATEGSSLDYAENYWLTLRSLPAEEIVTVVDCHI